MSEMWKLWRSKAYNDCLTAQRSKTKRHYSIAPKILQLPLWSSRPLVRKNWGKLWEIYLSKRRARPITVSIWRAVIGYSLYGVAHDTQFHSLKCIQFWLADAVFKMKVQTRFLTNIIYTYLYSSFIRSYNCTEVIYIRFLANEFILLKSDN